MVTIKVGSKRNVTFIPIDQDGNPNPVGSDGQPINVVGIPTWSLGEVMAGRVPSGREISGATLVPAADGMSCDVIADVAGISLALHCYADRGDGVQVHGGSLFETVGEEGSVPVIGSLTLQWGEEAAV